MTDTTPLTALLACPRCDRHPLDARGDGYHCQACDVDYPKVDDIPWMFAEPGYALGEWRGRLHFAVRQHALERARVARALSKSPSPTVRAALEILSTRLDDHVAKLSVLLNPLQVAGIETGRETYLALRTRLPSDQGLNTYYNNIHRDWAWGDEENAKSLEILLERARARLTGSTLVLGAGAGRLAYDLHMHSDAETTVALDFNPLLLMLAKKVTAGEVVTLYEFPIAPRSMSEQAVPRTLSAEAPARDGLELVLADAQRPPFAKASFDTVVTPWIVDILPERFDALSARVNHLLRDGGQWLNFGSLSFDTPNPALRYGPSEASEIVAAHGFAAPLLREDDIPYMCSPASRHARRERVVSWRAEKTSSVKKVPRHEALPDWLVRGKDPVPALDGFKSQAMSTRIHAFIMSLIDGRRSLKDMADVMAEQKLMPRDDAEAALRSFLIRMYEDSRRT